VPENLCVPIPEGVDFEAAAFGMLGCIALHGVREAGLSLGEKAVVIGLGLLGLLTVQFLTAQGCRVIGVDLDRKKCDLAQELGTDLALVPGEDNVEEAVANFTNGVGADAVLIVSASKDNQPLRLAEAVARERARLVLVGVADLYLTRKTFWNKELLFSVSKAAGPGSIDPLYEAKGFDYPLAYVRWTERRNLEACLDLVAQGKVRVDRLISHRFPIEEALRAYDLILGNTAPYIGVLLTYPEKGAAPASSGETRSLWLKLPISSSQAEKSPTVGLIGGGKFTKNILMPALQKVQGVRLAGVATTSGVSAQHLAQKYGFSYATTDYQEILRDEHIKRVIITTPHNLHGRQVVEALRAGKHVFVEKPLCLTAEELAAIEEAYDGSRMLLVGFNRRFAPLTQEVKKMLAGRTTPLIMTYRINAGYIPDDSWVHDPEVGGGRLLGEVCHFIDFMQFMVEAEPVLVSTMAIEGDTGKYRRDDNLAINLTFADGSVGSIIYTAKGSKAFSRERFEVYAEESVGVIEDFRRAQLVRGGTSRNVKKLSMDMGYARELAFFVKPESDHPDYHRLLFQGLIMSTRASLRASESLQTGRVMQVLSATGRSAIAG